MKLTIKTFLIFIIALLTSCMTSKYVSTIESINYDDKTNQTTFNKLPYGSISIPDGKWTKVSYNEISGQYNFKNVDSVFCAVLINTASGYPFYKPKMTSNEIVKAMYEWDSKYWAEQTGAKTSLLKQDTTSHSLIWQISIDKYKADNYYLIGSENGIIFTIMVDTKKWDLAQKTIFLETVYKNKKVGTCRKI
jgi:hypothetical protein